LEYFGIFWEIFWIYFSHCPQAKYRHEKTGIDLVDTAIQEPKQIFQKKG
jgi:hypothetical protein